MGCHPPGPLPSPPPPHDNILASSSRDGDGGDRPAQAKGDVGGHGGHDDLGVRGLVDEARWPCQPHRPGVWNCEAHQHPEQGGFAAAVAAEQHSQLADGNLEINAVQHLPEKGEGSNGGRNGGEPPGASLLCFQHTGLVQLCGPAGAGLRRRGVACDPRQQHTFRPSGKVREMPRARTACSCADPVLEQSMGWRPRAGVPTALALRAQVPRLGRLARQEPHPGRVAGSRSAQCIHHSSRAGCIAVCTPHNTAQLQGMSSRSAKLLCCQCAVPPDPPALLNPAVPARACSGPGIDRHPDRVSTHNVPQTPALSATKGFKFC